MKELPIPPDSLKVFTNNLKVVWRQWDVHSMLVFSFGIQLILILLGPLRKKSSGSIVAGSAWLAYLLADWVAAQAIGLVSKPCGSDFEIVDNQAELYAFWAQFLLLHLGGPDTITALALQDSELWHRTGLHLCAQVYGTGGVVFRSISQSQSGLWAPTILMFVAGVIKYTERLSSLFHGRLLKFSYQGSFTDPQDLPQYLPDELNRKIDEAKVAPKTDVVLVRDAYCFFECTKGLYAGQKLAQAQPEEDQKYFFKRTAEEAFRVLEIQLNLAYEAFYTKTVIICTTRSWQVLRHVVTLLEVGCLLIWMLFTNKSTYRGYNIRITYVMLLGAILVDVYAFLRIQLWSDWNIAQLNRESAWVPFYNGLLAARKRTWGGVGRKTFWQCLRRALFRRWSENIPQFNLITMYCDERSSSFTSKVIKFLGVGEEVLEQTSRYVTHKWFTNHLRNFIYEDLIEKSISKGAFENIGNVKGGWACMDLQRSTDNQFALPKVTKLLDIRGDYDLILMYWHVITELVYHETIADGEKNNYRDICKTLSDYLMYLLIHHREMMPINDPYVTNGRLFWMTRYLQSMRFRAIEEGEIDIPDGDIKSSPAGKREKKEKRRKLIYEHTRDNFYMGDPRTEQEKTYLRPIIIELMEFEMKQQNENGMWEFMAKVWGELLYYAAIRSTPRLHAERLKQGGELLSFVWLLLVQLGFGIQGNQNSGDQNALEKPQLYAYNMYDVGVSNWEHNKPMPKALEQKQLGPPASVSGNHDIP